MSVSSYARSSYNGGERDPDKTAAEFLREALAGGDPFGALLPVMQAAMSEEFRRLRRAMSDRVPLWDARPDQALPSSRITLTDRRAALLSEQVWVASTGGFVLWKNLTIEDITLTVKHYRAVVSGVEGTIQRLESARRVMEKHRVGRLGDAPWEEIADIVQE